MLTPALRACALTLPLALMTPAMAQDSKLAVTATSPDGSILLTISTDNDSRPTWSLSRKGKLLIAPSKLGFLLTDGLNMTRGFSIIGSDKASGKEKWEQPWGERRFVTDHHNELLVRFRQSDVQGNRLMNIRFRLFDNGGVPTVTGDIQPRDFVEIISFLLDDYRFIFRFFQTFHRNLIL